MDDGTDESHGRERNRRQEDPRRARDSDRRKRNSPGGIASRVRADRGGGALRFQQHDHAAVPIEGIEGSGGGEGIQERRHDVSRGIVLDFRRLVANQSRSRETGADGGRNRDRPGCAAP